MPPPSSRLLRPAARVTIAAVAASVVLAGCSQSGTTTVLPGTTTVEAWFDPVADGDTVTVTYIGSDCRDCAKAKVEETADTVTITVSESVTAGECDAVGIFYDVEVRLDAPLGDRRLVDGACAESGTIAARDCTHPA